MKELALAGCTINFTVHFMSLLSELLYNVLCEETQLSYSQFVPYVITPVQARTVSDIAGVSTEP